MSDDIRNVPIRVVISTEAADKMRAIVAHTGLSTSEVFQRAIAHLHALKFSESGVLPQGGGEK